MLLTLLAGNLNVARLPARAPGAYYAEVEPFIREQRASLIGALSTYLSATDLSIYFRRKQEVTDAEPFLSASNTSNLAITSFQPIPPVTTGSEFIIRARRRGRR